MSTRYVAIGACGQPDGPEESAHHEWQLADTMGTEHRGGRFDRLLYGVPKGCDCAESRHFGSEGARSPLPRNRRDNWTDHANWLTDAPLRDWSGVEVNEDGRVTRLHLGGWDDAAQDFIDHGLTGSLPPGLGALSHLRWLEIAGNAGLVGPIPGELSSLTRLEYLTLQANRLTGPIPSGFGHLPGSGNMKRDPMAT